MIYIEIALVILQISGLVAPFFKETSLVQESVIHDELDLTSILLANIVCSVKFEWPLFMMLSK